MQTFTDYGQRVINDLSYRYGISNDAVICMLNAVMNGNGTMAQFNCPELGGGGQWMQGGMTMVGDMFNYGLKNTVNNLCAELSNILSQPEPLFVPVKRQTSAYSSQQQSSNGNNSLFVSGGGSGNWWPGDLGNASSTGSQNNIRYAVFPSSCRLAVEINGQVSVYDTLDHQIGGVSQQQGYDASMTFTSQYGLIQVSQLPVVYANGNYVQQAAPEPQPVYTPEPQPISNNSAFENDIFASIEQLASLRDKGILTDAEFSAKKAELLQRL